MTNRLICLSGRLALVALCVVGLGAASPIMFKDNFNSSASAAHWEMVNGTWVFQKGKLIGPAENGSYTAIYVASTQSFTGDIETEVIYNQNEASNAEIVLNSTGSLVNEYRVSLWSKASSFFPSRWAVQTHKNGVQGVLIPPDASDVADGTIPAPFPIPTKARFTARRLGNTISLYVNGRKIGSVTDDDPLPAQGKVGLLVTNDTTIFDNFEVRSVRR